MIDLGEVVVKIHVKELPVSGKTGNLEGLGTEVLGQLIKEYYELEKLKEIEKTKRLEIKEQTKKVLRTLETLEKVSLEIIESNYNLREKILDQLKKILEKTDEPEIVELCLNKLIGLLDTTSLQKELEAVYIKIQSNEEIEI